MAFRCLDNNRIVREVKWLYIKNAWVPVVTVCTYHLYPRNLNPPSVVPDVTNLTLSLENLGVDVSWTSNANYDSEISFNKNNTVWETRIVSGYGTILDLNPGDTIEVRVRFTNGVNYSANYTTASITVWEIADLTLYGLNERFNSNFQSEANTIYSINFGDEFYTNKLKTFTQENIFEQNHGIAFYNGLIYRLIEKDRNGNTSYEFESIDPLTLEITKIPLSMQNFCSVNSMCFYPPTQYFYVTDSCGNLNRIDLSGNVTFIRNGLNMKGIDYYNNNLITFLDGLDSGPPRFYIVNPYDGTLGNGVEEDGEVPLFTLTYPVDHSFSTIWDVTLHDGFLHAIAEGSNQNYNGLFLIKIEEETTVGHTLSQSSLDGLWQQNFVFESSDHDWVQTFNLVEEGNLSFNYSYSEFNGTLEVKSNGSLLESIALNGLGGAGNDISLSAGVNEISFEIRGLDGNNSLTISDLTITNVAINIHQATVLSELTPYFKSLTSINVIEEDQLVIQQTDINYSGLYHISDNGVLGDLIINTRICCNEEKNHSVAFNPVDRHIYHASMRHSNYNEQDEFNFDPFVFVFEKLNPDTLEVTDIPTSGFIGIIGVEFTTASYINDGGDDMFDSGNFLSTNRSSNGFIEYTHTQQISQDNEDFSEIADGAVEDGTDYFGSGSTYFTNMYTGLFVMVARDIDIEHFTILGELGADGDGFVQQESITLNNHHTGYFKKVYGSGDPSVNHLIIIPTKTGVVSEISGDTNQDYHKLKNLSGVDYIYYLLFATQDGNNANVTTEQATLIGNLFLNAINGSGMTASNILTRLNSNVVDITNNIPDKFIFTDYVEEPREEFIGYQPGLSEPHCMTYQEGQKFLIASDEGLFSVTFNGTISLINTNFYWAECRGLAFVGNRLFATFSNLDQLAEVDPNTGELINVLQNKKGPSVFVDNSIIEGIRALASTGDSLILMAYEDNEVSSYTLAILDNLEADGGNILYATSIGTYRASGGLTVEKFGRIAPPGRWHWDWNEEFTGIRVPAYNNEEPIELNANELQVQWHEDDDADQSYAGWNDIAVQEVIQPENEGSDFVVVINKPQGNFMIRMRFTNPISKWSYYELD